MRHYINTGLAYTGFCLLLLSFWGLVFGLVYLMADIK